MSDVFWLSAHGLEVELPSKRQLTHESPFPVPFFHSREFGICENDNEVLQTLHEKRFEAGKFIQQCNYHD